MNGAVTEFVTLIDRFLAGEDTSLNAAREMESLLLEHFSHEDWFDEASTALAQYTPGGGDHMYDEADLAEVLKGVKADLQSNPQA